MRSVTKAPVRFPGLHCPICYWLPSSFFSSKASTCLYRASFTFIFRKYPYVTVYLERIMSTCLAPPTSCLSLSWSSLNHLAVLLHLMFAYDQPKRQGFHFLLPFSGCCCRGPGTPLCSMHYPEATQKGKLGLTVTSWYLL